MELSIIIVTYNSEKDIRNCLNSIIKKTEKIEYEIIIVDNDSQDNTRVIIKEYAMNFKNIKVIEAENRGFNAGNNIGIRKAKGEYIALLNPDTVLLNNAFEIILSGMRKETDIGACGATLYNKDLSLNMTHGSFPTLKETLLRILKIRNDETYYLANLNELKMKVDFPSGADFVFRKDIIEIIGEMDEEYFIYFDETDYALKMKKRGLKSYIYTEAKIVHLQGASTECMSDFANKIYIESYSKYLIKNIGRYERQGIIYLRILENKLRLIKNKIIKNEELKNENKIEVEKYNSILKKIKGRY